MIKEIIQEIFTDKIDMPQNNMRQHIDREDIFNLAADIKKNGLISPITVRPKGARFELVAGQRRYLAHQYSGIIKIKCVVRELTDEQALGIMTSENLSRVDVNPVDEANHVARLMEVTQNNIKRVSELVSRSEKWVRDRLAVGEMPDYMQELLAKKELKIGVALVLAQITDEGYRKMWTMQAVRDGANIAMAEYWLADFRRRFLPGGEFAEGIPTEPPTEAPVSIKFTCAIDGKEYDIETIKTIAIYKGNLEIFNAFISEFRKPPDSSNDPVGGI